MLKRKKHKKKMEKNLEESPEKTSEPQIGNSSREKLGERLTEICNGLFYISETDAAIVPFFGGQIQELARKEILTQTKSEENTNVEEKDFAEFFARLTEIQDWFGDEEKATAQKFAELRDLLKENLKDVRIFKLGNIQLDIYIVGLDAENRLVGVQTEAVET